MKKAEKVDLVKKLTDELAGAKSMVLVNYTGLNVKSQQALKARLKEVNARMVVVKNTLLKRAIEEAKLGSEATTADILNGQTAIVLGTDDAIAESDASRIKSG